MQITRSMHTQELLVHFLLVGCVIFTTSQATSTESGSQALGTADSISPDSGGAHLSDNLISENDPEFYKRLYDFGLGKRAYSYVSEYKRLPVYNFGLGKRSRAYNFGLGKRRQYSFGLGKRPADYDDYYSDEDDTDTNEEDLHDIEDSNDVSKRTKLYSFGLGKRAKPYSFGLGKREPGHQQSLYSFGLGKRPDHSSMYGFGLGKRADGRLYAFGLGKRPATTERHRFSFGLGKKSEEDNEFEEPIYEDEKRAQHRFSFGLGKREVSEKDLEAIKNEEKIFGASKHGSKTTGSGFVDKSKGNHEIVKRSLVYPLAIGKRGAYQYGSDADDDDEENADLARFIRKQYNFGLGKRVPMYDFGIGKRSEMK